MPQDLASTIALTALAFAVLALGMGVWLFFRLRRLLRAGTGSAAASDVSLEAAVAAEMERLAALESRVAADEDQARRAVQHIGVVRFNPFEDTGSNQSFALALLDDRSDGVVISSLHSRQQTRLYLKPIKDGRSELALSDEETEALRRAGAG